MSKPIFVTLLCLLCVSSLPSEAYGGRHSIRGQVMDRNGEPLGRAIVSLTPGNVELVTDKDGNFAIDYLREEDGTRTRLAKKFQYRLEVFKPGYHAYTLSFFYKKGHVVMDLITLTEESIKIEDFGENLDPSLYSKSTDSSGATYEGD